jgi:hypothetical protein
MKEMKSEGALAIHILRALSVDSFVVEENLRDGEEWIYERRLKCEMAVVWTIPLLPLSILPRSFLGLACCLALLWWQLNNE